MKAAVTRKEVMPKGKPKKDNRAKMLGFIHKNFPLLRPDLRHDTEGLKQARLDFATHALKRRVPLTSMKGLNEFQLGRVIEAIKFEMRTPVLPGANVILMPLPLAAAPAESDTADTSAEVIHLAGNEQVWAIERILDHLAWSNKGRKEFFNRMWKVTSPRQLKHAQAGAAFVILLNIGVSNEIKREMGKNFRVTREMIRQNTVAFKHKLGIGTGAKK
jgi:hypothetical protein